MLQLLDNRFPALHGLRVLAIFSIVAFHVNHGLSKSGILFKNRFWFGMDFFFVVSGFLIGSILLHLIENEGIHLFIKFYIRRAFRTLPLYYFTLLLLVVTYFILGRQSINWEFFHKELFFLTNYANKQDRFYMGWSWSLSMEEHFYLLSPFLILLIKRASKKIGIILLFVLFLVPAYLRWKKILISDDFYKEVYLPTHMRFDTLIMGMILAKIHRSHSEKITLTMKNRFLRTGLLLSGITLLLVCSCFFQIDMPIINYPKMVALSIGTFTSLAYACVIIWAIYAEGKLIRILGCYYFRVLATLGYGIYLIHMNAIAWVERTTVVQGKSGWLFVVLSSFALSTTYAYGAHLLVEKPFLKIRDKWK